jgi:hypothetical protein
MIKETWYLLYRVLDNGELEFVRRTTSGSLAFSWFNDVDTCVQIVTDTSLCTATGWEDFQNILSSIALRIKAKTEEATKDLPQGTCLSCRGDGEIGGQFCGGTYEQCPACNGTGVATNGK